MQDSDQLDFLESLLKEKTLQEGQEGKDTIFLEAEGQDSSEDEEGEGQPRFWRTSGGMVKVTADMPERSRNDFYPTPPALAWAAISLFPYSVDVEVTALDPGMGTGVWGRAARRRWPDAKIYGTDIADYDGDLSAYTQTFKADFLDFDTLEGLPFRECTHIFGNPPYSLMEDFTRMAYSLLAPNGHMIFLGPLEFLEGQERGLGIRGKKRVPALWMEIPPDVVYVLPQRPSFTGNGRTNARAYALYSWRKGYRGPTKVEWLRWR